MLLMVEKDIRGGICHAIHWYTKANNKFLKDYDKNKYWDVNNLYGWAMSQKLTVNDFKWVEDISDFIDNFIKTIMMKVIFSWSWCSISWQFI